MVSRAWKLLVFALLASASFSVAAKPTLSEREVKTLFESAFNHPARVQLGEFYVLTPNALAKPPRRYIPWSTYEQYEAWQKAGVVNLREFLDDPERNSFLWVAQQIAKRIMVSASESAAKFKDASGTNLLLPGSRYVVTKIVKNEERAIGVDDYRLVMLSFDFFPTREIQAYLKARNEKQSEKRNAILLFRFDAFQSKWTIRAYDFANAGEDFRTSRVRDLLGP